MQVDPGFREKKLTEETWPEEYYEYRKKWSEWPKSGKVGNYPLHIDLEVTNRCNLRCPFCVREEELRKGTWKVGDMNLITAWAILEECKHKVPSVKFNWRGEPTLYGELSYLIRVAKSRGFVETAINTNGTMLDTGMAAALCSAGLDRIIISIDSHVKESYEGQRVGARYEEVIGNLESLLAYKKAMKVERPYVRVQKVDIPRLRQENDDYLRFFEEMGVDSVAINTYKEKSSGLVDWDPLACAQPFQRLMVTWDGFFVPCCEGNRFRPIAKYGDMSVTQAWQSDIMVLLREAQSTGKQATILQCRECEATKPA